MSLGIGIGGMLNSGGGGAPTLADPSSFADSNALFLGDRGLTLVDGKLDTWENQGTDGGDAFAITASDTIYLNPNKGKFDFKDLFPSDSINFLNTGLNTGTKTKFTLSGITRITSSWNPGRMLPSLGVYNHSAYNCITWLGSQGFRITQRTGGTSTNTYWSLANMGISVGDAFAWRVEYDGTQAVNANRLKLYVNNVLKSSSTTPTHPTSVTDTDFGRLYITPTNLATAYSAYQPIYGFIGYWERLLTTDEATALQTWKESIWDLV